MKIKYTNPNYKDDSELKKLAHIHESAPKNWDKSYVVKDERVNNWVKYFKEQKNDLDFKIIVAKCGDKIIGLHWLKKAVIYDAAAAHVESLWVHEDFRGQGVGAELKKQGEDWAKALGANFIQTYVFYDNPKMINYNIEKGFVARQVEMIKELD